MKDIFRVLLGKKLQLFFLFYLVLLLPVLVFCMAQNVDLADSLKLLAVNGVLYMCLAVLFTFISPKAEKIIYFVLFLVSLIPGMVYTGYLLFAKVLLQHNSIISIFETNPEESREFVAHYFSKWLVLGQSVYILLCVLIVWKMRPYKRIKIWKHMAWFGLSVLFAVLLFSIPAFSRQIYFYNFYKIFVDYKSNLRYEKQAIEERQGLAYVVDNLQSDTLARTIVVVIGESLTRNHMSLYGYARQTTPRLDSLASGGSLVVYTDAVSPQVHTIPVLRAISSLREKDHPEYITQKPSMFELFNRAGYDTYFITNQPFGDNVTTSYDELFKLSKHQYNVAIQKQPDEVVFPPLVDILNTDDGKNKFIVIHLIGNHMAYEFRYTPHFSVFNHESDGLVADNGFRNKEAKLMIDRYDNSVLYNDYVVSEIISMLSKEENRDVGLIYFSDHGEEIYDSRNFAGHAYEKVSNYMCEIPFVVWMSDGYRRKRSDLVFDGSRAFSTAHFLQSLSDFSGLRYADFNDSLSLFSSNYVSPQRYVGDLTYDEVRALKESE